MKLTVCKIMQKVVLKTGVHSKLSENYFEMKISCNTWQNQNTVSSALDADLWSKMEWTLKNICQKDYTSTRCVGRPQL